MLLPKWIAAEADVPAMSAMRVENVVSVAAIPIFSEPPAERVSDDPDPLSPVVVELNVSDGDENTPPGRRRLPVIVSPAFATPPSAAIARGAVVCPVPPSAIPTGEVSPPPPPAAFSVEPLKLSPVPRVISLGAAALPVGLPRRRAAATFWILG